MSRRHVAVVAVVAVVAGAAAALATYVLDGTGPATRTESVSAAPAALATVVRRDLSAQTQVTATLGYAGSYSVINRNQGTVTALPQLGKVVKPGQVLYRVDGHPVVLLSGSTPAYRSLSEELTGRDVAELNTALVALGYATKAQLPAGTDTYTWRTRIAVEKLQADVGLAETGTLTLGQAVFLPGPARVTALSAVPGAPAPVGQPLLTASSTTRQISIALDAGQQSEVKAGDKVTVTLPSNATTPGVVSSVGKVAVAPAAGGSDSTPTITVLVRPSDPAATGSWDQAPVGVTITTSTVHNVLVVTVTALLALAGGGYAVETSSGSVLRLVPVALGLFDDADGLVQVTGTGLAAGQNVVVPS